MGPVTEQSEHLSNAQIENYGIRSSDAGPDAAQGDEHQRVEAHLADCPSCRNRLLEFHRTLFAPTVDSPEAAPSRNDASPLGDSPTDQKWVHSKDKGVRPTDSALADSKFANSKYPVQAQVRTLPTPECPSDDVLRQLAAGLSVNDSGAALTGQTATATSDAFTTSLLQHAATCNHCGPLLRTFTEDFSDDFSPEEQAALANLQSASAEWQKNTARHMLQAAGRSADVSNAATASTTEAGRPRAAATVKSDRSDEKSSAGRPVSSALDRKPFFWKWVLVPATAAIVAIAAFSVWYTQRDTPERVEKLLAQSYTEDRTMEMRIPYAKHGELHQLRSGDSGSLLSLPQSYRKAGDQITAHLKKNPDDPGWLLASAQFDLAHWDYPLALKTLDKIENAKFKSSSQLLMIRALALYQKAEDRHQQEAYFEAADLLGKVLLNAPNDPVALFNHAIVCERIESWQCAESDWNRLLTVETDQAWADEARDRLKQIESKKKAVH